MKIENAIYNGALGRKSLIDIEIPKDFNGEIILFIHGFMGFKNWGAWSLAQEYFVKGGFGFCKFNTSHNGGTSDNGIDFPDPEAFGNNTYSNEVEDLQNVVDWIDSKVKKWNGHVIGHSKGGAIALITGEQIEKIRTISTWAAIASIGERFPKEDLLYDWKKKGVRYMKNGRTHQELPQKYSLYSDYMENKDRYDLERICKNLQKPIFVAHGENDTSVDINNGQRLADWAGIRLNTISGADHVFGARQPWNSPAMPSPLLNLCEQTEKFILGTKS